ncbi:uncharacterized protein LOC128721099 [Anopheles nili]|uniref:uncharacterized protein LOC128721099 n=1 Tax=Anopheles nili TaxID=185578 RepID=UPI00237A5ED4|nr:uncharacterized protein LOC128721099 [Anopheles nili]
MSQDGNDIPIRVTHYINPHCFWYKPETAYMQDLAQAQFSAVLDEHCERMYGNRYEVIRQPQDAKVPLPGELVALRCNQLGRWIRCEMEELVVDLSDTAWYQLWALDEGFPVKSGTKYIRPLPDAFKQEPAHAKRGAIMNILPADTRYDYINAKQILEPCLRWCTGIVTTLETLLDDAVSVTISPKATIVLHNETVHFGHLYITTHQNISYNIVDLLQKACSDQLVATSNEEYFRYISTYQPLKMKRYLNNEGIDKMAHHVNNFDSHWIHKSTQPSKSPCAPKSIRNQDTMLVEQKVNEWLSRNKKACDVVLQKEKVEKDQTKQAGLINSIPHDIIENTCSGNEDFNLKNLKTPFGESMDRKITPLHREQAMGQSSSSVTFAGRKASSMLGSIKRHPI